MPTGLGLRPGAKAADEPPTPYRLRASPRLYMLTPAWASRGPGRVVAVVFDGRLPGAIGSWHGVALRGFTAGCGSRPRFSGLGLRLGRCSGPSVSRGPRFSAGHLRVAAGALVARRQVLLSCSGFSRGGRQAPRGCGSASGVSRSAAGCVFPRGRVRGLRVHGPESGAGSASGSGRSSFPWASAWPLQL